MPLDRGPFNALIDSDGTPNHGSEWDKDAIEDVLLDPFDDAIAGLATFNARQYGALGDGNNYATQIQAAIDAAEAALTGGVVLVPGGNYGIEIGLTLVGSRVTIRAEGRDAVIFTAANGLNGPILTIGNGSTATEHNVVEGIQFNGNSANQASGSCIKVHSTTRTTLRDVHVYDAKEHGVWIRGSATRNEIYCTITGESYIETNRGNGVYVEDDAYTVTITPGVVIAGNGKTPAGGAGFKAVNSDTHALHGVIFDENEYGVFLDNCSEVAIDASRFENQDRTSIQLTTCTSCAITGNPILNSGSEAADTYFGIGITDSSGCTVGGNTIRNVAGSPSIRLSDGIRETGTSDHNVIAENTITGDFLFAIRTVGANTRVHDNSGYVNQNCGATSVADGGTVSHGLSATPTRVAVTPSVSGEFVSVTAIGATTFTVAIKKHDNTAGTTQTVYWEAERKGGQ